MNAQRPLFGSLFWQLGAVTAAGFWLGYPFEGATAVLGWHLYRNGKQFWRLSQWLNDKSQPIPESDDAWDDIFRKIYYLQRDEQRAQASLLSIIDRARASVSALEEAVTLIDSHGNIEWWNPAAERILGFRANDKGQPVTNIIRAPSFHRFFESGHYQHGLKISSQRFPGRQLQFEITRFGDNDRIMIVYDITHLHNLEQMRKDFVANVSHELRTPLTVLTGYLETLLEQAEHIDPRWYRALSQMEQQATRMNSLVNDLLLLSRLENQPEDREPQIVNVPRMLRQTHADALALSQSKKQEITLNVEPDLCLLGMDADLRSAFSNLVTNAVKYTGNGGKIEIRWWSNLNGAHFSVSDNGYGIDPVHIPRLTERFYRADSARNSSTGGTGLGLAIVKHVLMQHKAQLEIHSELGKGSRFSCHFPVSSIERETPSDH